jgi:hypothetical protein
MSPHFRADLGPLTINVQLDDAGIRLQRGSHYETIEWRRISGATLVRAKPHEETREPTEGRQAARFLSPEIAQTIDTLRDQVGKVAIAYRDQHNHVCETEVPVPLDDPAFEREFASRLGVRWLGESVDQHQAAKRLHTNPSFLKSTFIVVALLGTMAMVAGIVLLGLLGPVLNLLSIQKMLLDLQDGDLIGFARRLLTYLGLFTMGYFLNRAIRNRRDSLKGRRIASRMNKL